jgi:hypothetical protein
MAYICFSNESGSGDGRKVGTKELYLAITSFPKQLQAASWLQLRAAAAQLLADKYQEAKREPESYGVHSKLTSCGAAWMAAGEEGGMQASVRAPNGLPRKVAVELVAKGTAHIRVRLNQKRDQAVGKRTGKEPKTGLEAFLQAKHAQSCTVDSPQIGLEKAEGGHPLIGQVLKMTGFCGDGCAATPHCVRS